VSLLWSGFGLVRSEGALDYRFDGQPMRSTRMMAGDLFVYPQGETMYVNMPQPVELTCIQLAPAVLVAVADEAGCTARVAAGGSLRADDVTTMATLLEGEVRSGCEGGRFYGEHLAYALAAKLIQRYGAADDARADRRMHGRKLAAVLDHIHAHATEDLSLEDLARVARLSPSISAACSRPAPASRLTSTCSSGASKKQSACCGTVGWKSPTSPIGWASATR